MSRIELACGQQWILKGNPQNSPFERIFKFENGAGRYNVQASYDPNVIQGRISEQEVQSFLDRLLTVKFDPAPCMGWFFCMLCGGICVIMSYSEKIQAGLR